MKRNQASDTTDQTHAMVIRPAQHDPRAEFTLKGRQEIARRKASPYAGLDLAFLQDHTIDRHIVDRKCRTCHTVCARKDFILDDLASFGPTVGCCEPCVEVAKYKSMKHKAMKEQMVWPTEAAIRLWPCLFNGREEFKMTRTQFEKDLIQVEAVFNFQVPEQPKSNARLHY